MRNTASAAAITMREELNVARAGKVGAAIMTKLLNSASPISAPAYRTAG